MKNNVIFSSGSIALFILILCLYTPVLFFVTAAFMSDVSLSSGIPSLKYALNHQLSLNDLQARFFNIYFDSQLKHSFVQSILTSLSTACLVASISWIAGYIYTRSSVWWIRATFPIAIMGYLLPPVVLAIGISEHKPYFLKEYVPIQIFLGHCVYLFPLAYALSIGYWLQKPLELDRIAASDGLGFWERLFAHMGKQEISRLLAISLLVFMVSWGDVAFSRVIAGAGSSDRLIVDIVFQRLYSNSVTESYGALSAFSIFVILISSIFSIIFGFAIVQEDKRGS